MKEEGRAPATACGRPTTPAAPAGEKTAADRRWRVWTYSRTHASKKKKKKATNRTRAGNRLPSPEGDGTREGDQCAGVPPARPRRNDRGPNSRGRVKRRPHRGLRPSATTPATATPARCKTNPTVNARTTAAGDAAHAGWGGGGGAGRGVRVGAKGIRVRATSTQRWRRRCAAHAVRFESRRRHEEALTVPVLADRGYFKLDCPNMLYLTIGDSKCGAQNWFHRERATATMWWSRSRHGQAEVGKRVSGPLCTCSGHARFAHGARKCDQEAP